MQVSLLVSCGVWLHADRVAGVETQTLQKGGGGEKEEKEEKEKRGKKELFLKCSIYIYM